MLTVLAVKRRRQVTSCSRVNVFHRDPDARRNIYFAENPLTRTSAPSPITRNHNNDTPTTTPTAIHTQLSSTRTAYCTQPTPCNSRGGVDVMSTQPSATEPGDANNNDGDCQIINDGAGDGSVEASKGDESASVTSAVQQAQAAFVVYFMRRLLPCGLRLAFLWSFLLLALPFLFPFMVSVVLSPGERERG